MKTANFVAFQSPQFSILSDSQLQRLHLAALEVLRRTGIRFHHQEALDMLKKAGAFISDGNLVKFPARLVEEAIASVPCRVIMCDRDGEPAVYLEGNKVYFGTGSDCLNFLDPETGEHRKFTQADLSNAYRLCDALPNIHFVMSIGIPTDVDHQRPQRATHHQFRQCIVVHPGGHGHVLRDEGDKAAITNQHKREKL